MRARPFLLLVALAVQLAAAPSLASDGKACSAQSLRCCEPAAPTRDARPKRLEFGLQIWPEDVTSDAEALLAMRPSAFRYSGGPSWQRAPRLSASASFAEALAFVRARFDAERPKYEQQAASIAGFASQAGAKAHFVVWEPPATDAEPAELDPARDKRQFYEAGIAGTANFYAALFKVLGEFGYPIDAAEISNEPDGDWNLRIPPRSYAKLLEAVRLSAGQNGVRLPPIAGPGTSSIAALNNVLRDEPIARSMLSQLDVVSVHGWDDRNNKDVLAEAARARIRLTELGREDPVAVTEFGLTFLQPEDRANGRGAMTRSPRSVSEGQDYAAHSISTALSLASLGFGPIIYWEYRDPPWGKASYGLKDVTGRPRPTHAGWTAASALARDRAVAKIERRLDGSAFVLSGPDAVAGAVFINRGPDPIDLVFGRDAPSREIARLARAESRPGGICSSETGEPGIRLAPGEIRLAR